MLSGSGGVPERRPPGTYGVVQVPSSAHEGQDGWNRSPGPPHWQAITLYGGQDHRKTRPFLRQWTISVRVTYCRADPAQTWGGRMAELTVSVPHLSKDVADLSGLLELGASLWEG